MVSIKKVVGSVKKGSNPFESELKKLVITGYQLSDYSQEIGQFTVQFNPSELNESVSLNFVKNTPLGTEESKKMASIPSRTLSMKITLDETGTTDTSINNVSPLPIKSGGNKQSIKNQIDLFKKVTYDYVGDEHDLPYVSINWGDYIFKGRITTFQVNYVLFKSDGNPIRAVIQASFESSTEAEYFAKKSDKKSPDLTHIRTVKVGDTLPLMCQQIYKDSSHYLKVARFNNIRDFRNIEPGTEIIFPPLI